MLHLFLILSQLYFSCDTSPSLWVSLPCKNKVPKQHKKFQNHLNRNLRSVIQEEISESSPWARPTQLFLVAGTAEQTFASPKEWAENSNSSTLSCTEFKSLGGFLFVCLFLSKYKITGVTFKIPAQPQLMTAGYAASPHQRLEKINKHTTSHWYSPCPGPSKWH